MINHTSACTIHDRPTAGEGNIDPSVRPVEGYNRVHRVLFKRQGDKVIVECQDCGQSVELYVAHEQTLQGKVDAAIAKWKTGMYANSEPDIIWLGSAEWAQLHTLQITLDPNGIRRYKGITLMPALPNQNISILVWKKVR